MQLLKKLKLLLLVVVWLSSTACQDQEETQNIYTLEQTVNGMIEANTWYFLRLEKEAIQYEAMDEFRSSLDSIRSFMVLRDELFRTQLDTPQLQMYIHALQTTCSAYMANESASELQESLDSFNAKVAVWKSLTEREKSKATQLQLFVYLDALRLEQLIMKALSNRIDHPLIDYFFARADFYHKEDTLSVGEVYRAIITVGKPEIAQYKYLKLADPIIYFNEIREEEYQNLQAPNYQLTAFEPWSWLIEFTPDKPGLYAIGIESHVKSQILGEKEQGIQLIQGISQPFLVEPSK